MLQILKIFFYAEKTKPWLVLLLLVLGGMAEAIGIGSVLPVANTMLGTAGNPASPLESAIRKGLATIGLTPTLEVLLIALTSLLVLRAALLFAATTYSGMASARVTVNLRRRLIKALFEARWKFYTDQASGQIANALSNNANVAGNVYGFSATVATIFVQIAAYLTAAFFINWRVAAAGLCGGLLVALISGRLVTVTHKAGHKITSRVESFTADAVDVMQNIKALKSMNRYEPLLLRITEKLTLIRRSMFRATAARVGLTYGNDAMIAIFVATSAYLANRFGHISLPELTVFGLLFYQVIYCISRLQKTYQQAAEIQSAYQSVTTLIANAEAAKEPHTGTATPQLGKGCHFENVTYAHGENATVQNLNFEIPANQITVLQGPSGAGKTTIVDLLIGLHQPQSGTIKIGTENLANIDIEQWRSHIGYVPQELVLFHDTVLANITLNDNTITSADVASALARAGAEEFVQNLLQGLETDVGEMGSKLSGGQRQRISLARALVKNPSLIILDEVTSALDPESEAEIVRNIKSLRGRYTIVAITHRPAWTAIADKLYKVQAGRLTEIKRPKAVKKK